jgi:NAD(P)-dependent dehydrogenase (short-subunit alcohol dehydrogenase family)
LLVILELAAGPLDGRVSLVRERANGFGRAISNRLAEAGSMGLVLDRQTALAASTPPSNWLTFAADPRHEEEVHAAIAGTVEHFGTLDIVAGVVSLVRNIRHRSCRMGRDLCVNVRGVICTIKRAVRR